VEIVEFNERPLYLYAYGEFIEFRIIAFVIKRKYAGASVQIQIYRRFPGTRTPSAQTRTALNVLGKLRTVFVCTSKRIRIVCSFQYAGRREYWKRAVTVGGRIRNTPGRRNPIFPFVRPSLTKRYRSLFVRRDSPGECRIAYKTTRSYEPIILILRLESTENTPLRYRFDRCYRCFARRLPNVRTLQLVNGRIWLSPLSVISNPTIG